MMTFVKILEYDLAPTDIDTFVYLTQLGLQEIDPPSLQPGQLILAAPVVLYSSMRRSIDCIRRKQSVKYVCLPQLNEVVFDLRTMCSTSEWDAERDCAVRRAFKEAFIEDRLMQPREDILRDVESVLRKCLVYAEEGDIAVVSHSFRMKVIEAYVRSRGMLRADPAAIHGFIEDEAGTYPFGGGFELTEKDVVTFLESV